MNLLSRGYLGLLPMLLVVGRAPQDLNAQGHISDLEGVSVGHAEMSGRPTGCTVVLFDASYPAGVDVRGAAPGTRETDLLDPVNTVQGVDAVVLSGGSAYGLSSADGVVRFLEEQGRGYPVGGGVVVPIVPAAIIFDLFVGDDPSIRPDADCGYRAASSASADDQRRGNVGAGAGATLGKLRGSGRAMKGGMGSAVVRGPNGLMVGALVVLNPVGDIIDPATGAVVAGVRSQDGQSLEDARHLILGDDTNDRSAQNTTIGVVVTNAVLTKTQANRVAQMAHDGLARTIYPVHTPFDGDALFAVSTGRVESSLFDVGVLAAEAVARAVLDAARSAESLPGLPAAGDFPGDTAGR